MRYFIFLIPFLFINCSIKPNSDEYSQINRYRILTPKISKTKQKTLNKTIKVALPVAPKFLFSDKIAYMKKDGSFGFFQFSKWDENPAKQLQFLLANSIRQSNLYQNVIISPTLMRDDFLLESRVDTFTYLYDTTHSKIKIDINVYLINSHSKEIIKSNYFSVEEKVEKNKPDQVILGFHRAIRLLNQKIINWLQ